MCERCPELEERVAYLESELGIQRETDGRQRLHAAMPATNGGVRGVDLVLALYAARGRTLSRWQLLDAIPSPGGVEDREPKLIDVWVHGARFSLGRDVITTVWGRGYCLSAKGIALVAAIIAPERVAA